MFDTRTSDESSVVLYTWAARCTPNERYAAVVTTIASKQSPPKVYSMYSQIKGKANHGVRRHVAITFPMLALGECPLNSMAFPIVSRVIGRASSDPDAILALGRPKDRRGRHT